MTRRGWWTSRMQQRSNSSTSLSNKWGCISQRTGQDTAAIGSSTTRSSSSKGAISWSKASIGQAVKPKTKSMNSSPDLMKGWSTQGPQSRTKIQDTMCPKRLSNSEAASIRVWWLLVETRVAVSVTSTLSLQKSNKLHSNLCSKRGRTWRWQAKLGTLGTL